MNRLDILLDVYIFQFVVDKVWSDEGALTEGESASGRTAGIVAYFDGRVTKVDLTVGLSFVDLEGARRNLDAEHPRPPHLAAT